MVWDYAWGTGNLTRDYNFKELYCSTLVSSDIEIGERYSKNATSFQYDFLNDDIEINQGKDLLISFMKMPQKLLEAFEQNKPILFLINPPFAIANNAGTKNGDHKSGVALTKMNILMKAEIVTTSVKNIYNLDNTKGCSDWIKERTSNLNTIDAPQMSNAINVKQIGRAKLVKGALGYYVNVSNNIYKNSTDVYMLSSAGSTGNGVSIMEENFDKVVSNFAARRLISGMYINWINAKDEYCVPDISNKLYNEWLKDSLVYSLFNNASNQSSLRKIMYKGKEWDIVNNFFFMSCKDMMNLAIKYKNDEVNYDCKNFSEERFVYQKLKELTLSVEADRVLKEACKLINNSFKFRENYNIEYPKYNLNTWDATWYQIKLILKEYMKNELDGFNISYKNLEDKMRPLVYKLGFVK